MKKWIISILIMIVLLPIVQGICCERNEDCIVTETCQDADCGNCTITIFNREGTINITPSNMVEVTSQTYTFNISTNLSIYGTYPYTINCSTGEVCQGDCYVELKQECEVEEMEGLAVMLFVMIITAMFFIVPIKVRFSKNELANFILKRCSIILGLFFLSLNTAIMATVADSGGLDILDELFRYLWFINLTIYISMLALIWVTVRGTMKLWDDIAKKKRMGENDE